MSDIPDQEEYTEIISLFRRKFPMFADEAVYSADRVRLALLISYYEVDKEKWPNPENKEASMYWHARFLLTAHRLVLQDNAINEDGTAKANTDSPVTWKAVGGLSISFSNPAKVGSGSTGSTYESTTFGREYLSLTHLFGAGCLVV